MNSCSIGIDAPPPRVFRRPERWFVLVLAAAAISVPDPRASARAQVQMFAVDSLSATLVSGAYSDRVTRDWTSSRPLLRDNEMGLIEAMSVGIGGALYHPQLFSWTSTGKLTLKQRSLSSARRDSGRRIGEVLNEFRIAGTLLRSHAFTLRLSASRNVSNVDGDFIDDIYVNRSSRGVVATWRAGRTNQVLDYMWNDYESAGLVRNKEVRNTLRYEATRGGERFHGNAKFEASSDDLVLSGTKFNTRTGQMTGTLRLDDTGRRTISSLIYYNRLESAFDSRDFQGSVRANIGLWKDLDVATRYSRRHGNVSGIKSSTDIVGGSVIHRLYRSVVTTLTGNGTFPDYDDGSQFDRKLTARSDYRKRTFFGNIGLHYEYGVRRYREDFDRLISRPQQRSFVYTPGVPIIIDDAGVDSTTIEVVNLSRPGIVPEEGLDYTVAVTGGRFEIEILPFASIRPGDNLNIRFLARVQNKFEFEETSPAYGFVIGITSHVSLDASRRKTTRDLLYGMPTATIEDSEVENASVRLNWKRLRAEGRYQNRITAINPYRRRAASVNYQHTMRRNLNLIVNSRYSVTDFPEDRSRLRDVTFAGRIWYRPTRRLVVQSQFRGLIRAGRRDDGHDYVVGGSARYVINTLELLFKFNAYNRDVTLVGTEVRTIASFELRRHF